MEFNSMKKTTIAAVLSAIVAAPAVVNAQTAPTAPTAPTAAALVGQIFGSGGDTSLGGGRVVTLTSPFDLNADAIELLADYGKNGGDLANRHWEPVYGGSPTKGTGDFIFSSLFTPRSTFNVGYCYDDSYLLDKHAVYNTKWLTARFFNQWDSDFAKYPDKLEKLALEGVDVQRSRSFDERVFVCAKTFAVKMFEARGVDASFDTVDLWGLRVSDLENYCFNADGVGNEKEAVFFAVTAVNGFKWGKGVKTYTTQTLPDQADPAGYTATGTEVVDGFKVGYKPTGEYFFALTKSDALAGLKERGWTTGATLATEKVTVITWEKKTCSSAIYSLDGVNAPKKGFEYMGKCQVAYTIRLHLQADDLYFASPMTLNGASEYSQIDGGFGRVFVGFDDRAAWWIDDNCKAAKSGSQWGVSQLTWKNGRRFASKFIGSNYKPFEYTWENIGAVGINDQTIKTAYFDADVATFDSTDYTVKVLPCLNGATGSETQAAKIGDAAAYIPLQLGLEMGKSFDLWNVPLEYYQSGFQLNRNKCLGYTFEQNHLFGLLTTVSTDYNGGSYQDSVTIMKEDYQAAIPAMRQVLQNVLIFHAGLVGDPVNEANREIYIELVSRLNVYEALAKWDGKNLPALFDNHSPENWLKNAKAAAAAEFDAAW